jgi:hypothetical protein
MKEPEERSPVFKRFLTDPGHTLHTEMDGVKVVILHAQTYEDLVAEANRNGAVIRITEEQFN